MRVEIKTWDEMAKEFGVSSDGGHIDCDLAFTERMEKTMPKSRVIGITKKYDSVNSHIYTWRRFNISIDMIKRVIRENNNESQD